MAWRIRDRATFEALRQSSARARRGPVRVIYAAVGGTERPRVAYAVGRRAGTAVARNHLRRRLRSAVQESDRFEAGAYLVSAGPEAAGLGFQELSEKVTDAMTAASRLSAGGRRR